ncbi:MAG: hypothetical protein NUW21_09700 [Elusimicrobia bacterium]|nr:hypothetical protein [Elusimicrobiota bacterium]
MAVGFGLHNATEGFGPELAELKRRLGFEYDGMILHEHYFGILKAGQKPLGEDSAPLWHEEVFARLRGDIRRCWSALRARVLPRRGWQRNADGESANPAEAPSHFGSVPSVRPQQRVAEKNPWFEDVVLPRMRKVVRRSLG